MDLVILPNAEVADGGVTVALDPTMWPFLQILIAADDDDLERWATSDFGTDRAGHGKGVVEVLP